jgi:hypothetical protein
MDAQFVPADTLVGIPASHAAGAPQTATVRKVKAISRCSQPRIFLMSVTKSSLVPLTYLDTYTLGFLSE